MEENSPEIKIREVEQGDIEGIAALFDAADRADGLFKLASEEDIRESFAGLPTEQTRAFIAVADTPLADKVHTSGIVGLGRISAVTHSEAHERVFYVMLRVHPVARQHGLQHTIARHLIEKARQFNAHTPVEGFEKARLVSYVFSTQHASIEAWEQSGLRLVRTGWTMARNLAEPIPPSVLPNEVMLRTYRHPADNERALAAYNLAMADYYDFHPVSLAAWEREMAAHYARPDLSWVAWHNNEIIGISGCQVNNNENAQSGRKEGWIEGIGVMPSFRRSSVGKALLAHSLQSLKDDGLEWALADVDSESAPAVSLFKGAGFRVRSALGQYECALENTRP